LIKFIAAAALAGFLLAPVHASAVVNKTGQTMVEFYASVTNADTWEEDILGDDILEDDEAVDVNVDDGSGKCVYDFRAVFESGAEAVKRGVNVCQISTFTFTR
jgi:FlaG/FlaF family flagellin (archaellin)